jgi:hypothetical protein
MSDYRYQLERYRGRGTRHVCPQCHRKGTFTRYIDTYNNNIYISENVGKCNRIDKCGYHYTPKQYYTDNPWKRDTALVERVGRYDPMGIIIPLNNTTLITHGSMGMGNWGKS